MRFKTPAFKNPDKAIKKIKEIAKSMSGPDSVKVGLPKGSNNYPDGTSVIMVGSVHEFGSPSRNVPERSFLRSNMMENKREYKALLSSLGAKIATAAIDPLKALSVLGLRLQTDTREKITDLDEPQLKNREGNPLVDTGHLRQSIVYKVGE